MKSDDKESITVSLHKRTMDTVREISSKMDLSVSDFLEMSAYIMRRAFLAHEDGRIFFVAEPKEKITGQFVEKIMFTDHFKSMSVTVQTNEEPADVA